RYEEILGKYRERLALLNAQLNLPLPEKGEKVADFILALAQVRREYEILLAHPPKYKYGLSGWLTPYFWNNDLLEEAQKKPQPTTVAAALGALARADGVFAAAPAYQTAAFKDQYQKLKPMLELEKNKRIQVGKELIAAEMARLLPSSGAPFTLAGMTYYAGLQQHYMPVAGHLEDELRTNVEEKRAQD